MLEFLKRLFHSEPAEIIDFKSLKRAGAIVIDVRTIGEYRAGHIKGATNIAVQVIDKKIERIKKYKKPIICYCRSGQRSKLAANILKKNGIEAYNGGAFPTLKQILK